MEQFDILIRNGRIWTGEKFLDGSGGVAVKSGKIVGIGSFSEEEAEYVYDARGAVISPGFVDIHMHMRGFSCEEYAFPAEAGCFPFGVTCAVDAGTVRDAGKHLLPEMLLDAGAFIAPDIRDDDVDPAETERLLREYGEHAVGLKVFFGANADVRSGAPLRKIAGLARGRGLRVMVHCTQSPIPMSEILEVLREGDICSHIFHGGVHQASEEDLRKAREKGIILDAAMAGGVHTDFLFAKSMIAKGILPDVISTDLTRKSAFVRGGLYGMTMSMSMMRSFGMPEEKVLRAVTSSAAKAVGKGGERGLIAPGRDADLAVVRFEEVPFDIPDNWGHRASDASGYRCLLTVCKGRVAYRGL